MTEIRYTIGADPELFLKVGEAFVSAHDVLPGTKTCVHEVAGGAIHVDGVAAEFNIHPAGSLEEFLGSIHSTLSELQRMLREKNPALRLSATPVADFEPDYFKKLPTDAKALGCMPDFNAWTGKQNPKPKTKETFRTGAGHIHVGWDEWMSLDPNDHAHFFDCTEVVKQLDCCLYMMSLVWDRDRRRRTLYGEAGAFRPKQYGVEYRPLSNAWLRDPDLHVWIYEATTHGLKLLDEDKKLWEDNECNNTVQVARDPKVVFKPEPLRIYHDYLVEHYDFPPLPDDYVRTT